MRMTNEGFSVDWDVIRATWVSSSNGRMWWSVKSKRPLIYGGRRLYASHTSTSHTDVERPSNDLTTDGDVVDTYIAGWLPGRRLQRRSLQPTPNSGAQANDRNRQCNAASERHVLSDCRHARLTTWANANDVDSAASVLLQHFPSITTACLCECEWELGDADDTTNPQYIAIPNRPITIL